MKTIIVPIDFSPVTKDITREAIRLARIIRAQLILVHVVEPPSALRDLLPVGAKIAPEVLQEARKIASARLTQWQKKLHRSFAGVDVVSLTGQPVVCILNEALRRRATYIVLGSHGHSSVYDMLVGSVAKGVQTRASCPVVVIPALGSKASRLTRPTIELEIAGKR
jgi:hypothetical protein